MHKQIAAEVDPKALCFQFTTRAVLLLECDVFLSLQPEGQGYNRWTQILKIPDAVAKGKHNSYLIQHSPFSLVISPNQSERADSNTEHFCPIPQKPPTPNHGYE